MNLKKTFFDLPLDILSKIYEYDDTFHKIFASEKARLDIRYMSHKIKHNPKYLLNFMKTKLLTYEYTPEFLSEIGITREDEFYNNGNNLRWGYVRIRSLNWRPDLYESKSSNTGFGHNYEIFLYPKERFYTRYKILHPYHSHDFEKYDGYICNEEQNNIHFECHHYKSYKNDELDIRFFDMDNERGLYLHIRN
jgi:hypothetical protein